MDGAEPCRFLSLRVWTDRIIPMTVVRVVLRVHYTDQYPDTLPDLVLESADGELEDKEEADLLQQLRDVVWG